MLVLGAAVIASCAGLPAGARDRDPAMIIFHGDTATIESPDTVTVGEPFRVRITTFGGGCIRRTAGAEILPREGVIEIRPYNHDTGGPICTRELMFLVHEIDVRAESAGPVVLRVIGTARDAGTPDTRTAQLERRIFAR